MKIRIKNMVCSRCKTIVQSEFIKLGINPISVELGEVEIETTINISQKYALIANLKPYGFLLIEDKKSKLIEKIKNCIVELVHYSDSNLRINLSDFIVQKVDFNYSYLSRIFTEVEGITIEKYYIIHKIERVKELLAYDELSLSEIAIKLGYSSVAYLSNQFKRITSITPSEYKLQKIHLRQNLEEVKI
ncbi:MAG: AraC family transcriptional regulator [bacterium]|nr:AraC family transcriptional regulator [bacterium]